MADKRKIVIEVDDSQFKKYTEEEKRATVKANEDQKRQTAQLKAELNTRYAALKNAYDKEVQAQKTGDELKIKQAVKERIAKTRELNLYEIEVKKTNRLIVEDTKQAHRLEILSYKNKIREMSNAPRTNLRGAIGSEAYVSQLIGAQKKMQVGSSEFNQTGLLIDRYQTSLKGANREVKSLSQQIGGELNNTLKSNVSNLLSSSAAYLGLGIAISKTTQFVTESVREYMKQETALRTLTFAVEKVNRGNSEATKNLVDFAEETQSLYNINDDVIEQSQAYLVLQGRTEKQIKELIKTAVDLSAVQGDLSNENVIANVQKLDATYEGVTGKLGKYDSRIKDLTQTQLENGDAVRLLGEKFKGTAEEVNKGTEGAWRKWTVGLGEAKEAIGGVIAFLITFNQKISDVTQDVQASIQNILKEIAGLRNESQQAIVFKVIVESEMPSPKDLRGMLPEGANLEDAVRMYKNATNTTWEEAYKKIREQYGFATENEANSPTRNNTSNSGSKNSGSKTSEEIQKELNLIKQLEAELVKQNEILEANRNDIGAERQIRADILEIEKQIYRYRTGIVNDNKFKMTSPVDQLRGWNSTFSPKGVGVNPNAFNDPRGDMLTDELKGIELSFSDIKSTADSIVTPFQNILGLAGLTETEFGKMLQMIQGLFNAGSSVFDIFSTVLSFIPGGSVVGGVVGGAGGALSGGMPKGMNNNMPIIIKGTLNKYAEYQIVRQGTPEYQAELNATTL